MEQFCEMSKKFRKNLRKNDLPKFLQSNLKKLQEPPKSFL